MVTTRAQPAHAAGESDGYRRTLKRERVTILMTTDMRQSIDKIAIDEDYDSISDLVRSLIKEKIEKYDKKRGIVNSTLRN